MATLDFFCNRPTVVALIEFGSQISDSPGNATPTPAKVVEESDTSGSVEAVVPRDVVKGLLGRGKSRVVFRLKLVMESARISVNKEDGTQLGMLVQDEFRFELKVNFIELMHWLDFLIISLSLVGWKGHERCGSNFVHVVFLTQNISFIHRHVVFDIPNATKNS